MLVVTDGGLPRARRPLAFVFGVAVAGVIALSLHVAALTIGIPYPLGKPPTWAQWLNSAGSAVALVAFLRLAALRIGRYSFAVRFLLAFVVFAMIRETLRAAIMNGVVTGNWAPSLLGLIEPVVRAALVALLCAIAARWARGRAAVLVAGLVVGGVMLALAPLIKAAFKPLSALIDKLATPDLYTFPYPLVVNLPAYLTFAEAAFAAALIAMFTWDRLPGSTLARAALLALLVATMKGVLIATLVFSFFMEISPLMGMLAYGQFLVEFLALGFLVGLAWARFGR